MQWLIDIAIAAIQNWIYANGIYRDRGSYAIGEVRQIGDFTADGAWHELDLSDVIDQHAKAAEIRIKASATAINKTIRLRPHGTTSTWHTCILNTQIANVLINSTVAIGVDLDGKIDYEIDPAFTLLGFIVRGWWL